MAAMALAPQVRWASSTTTRSQGGRRCPDERLFQHGGIQDLALLDMEELEACEALHQNLHLTLPDLLTDWQASEYSKTPFRSFLTLRFGGRNIGRPDDIEAALHETMDMITGRLGFREDSTG
jgi:hypothetical protein